MYGKSHLSELHGQEYMKWLQALKLSKEEPELFYAVGLYTFFVKGDVKKAQQLLEKALAFKPDFCEAMLLLCVILMSTNQTIKASNLMAEFQ